MTEDMPRILVGDCLQVMPTLAANSIDAIVSDPPYGLGFMGKQWDHGVPGEPFWREALRVAKPGAHIVAFGGTRTFHRLVSAIEDAGWEIRDVLMWVYGSGFPKSLDVAKAIDKIDRIGPMRDRALAFTAWMRSTGLTVRQINEATNTCMGSHYLTDKEQPAVPTRELFEMIRPALTVAVPQFIEDLIDSRVVERENEKRRPVIGEHDRVAPVAEWRARYTEGSRAAPAGKITSAYTPEAQEWEGWGTALKPAWEPIILARKPLQGTVAGNVLKFGTGALNIDGCRIGSDGGTSKDGMEPGTQTVNALGAALNTTKFGQPVEGLGRWPANVCHDGSDEVVALFPSEAGGGAIGRPQPEVGRRPGGFGNVGHESGDSTPNAPMYADTGSAARFFYTAKASREDRNWGCDQFAEKPLNWSSGTQNPGSFQAEGTKREARNNHPTVKPHELMRWLCRLVTPPGGLVLDPFCGSGSTGRAAIAEGFRFVGIELDPEYAAIAEARMKATQPGFSFGDAA